MSSFTGHQGALGAKTALDLERQQRQDFLSTAENS
jgi:hypothetical protein